MEIYRQIYLIALLMLSANIIHADSRISIHPDTLYFTGIEPESLFVINSGNSLLQIDSIRNIHPFIYDAIINNNSIFYTFRISCSYFFSIETQPIIIDPFDSVLIEIYRPDLCPICKSSIYDNSFTDSLFFYSNDTTRSLYIIYSHGWGYNSYVNNGPDLDIINSELFPSYPNPFNNNTTIRYSISRPSHTELSVFDLNGRLVINLVNTYQSDEYKEIIWDGINNLGHSVSCGIYFLVLKVGNEFKIIKLSLVK